MDEDDKYKVESKIKSKGKKKEATRNIVGGPLWFPHWYPIAGRLHCGWKERSSTLVTQRGTLEGSGRSEKAVFTVNASEKLDGGQRRARRGMRFYRLRTFPGRTRESERGE